MKRRALIFLSLFTFVANVTVHKITLGDLDEKRLTLSDEENRFCNAVSFGDVNRAAFYLDQGVDPCTGRYASWPAIMMALSNNDLAMFELLLSRGVDVHMIISYGFADEPLIFFALERCQPAIIQSFLHAGVSPQVKDFFGRDLIMKAVYYNRTDLILLLLEAGVSMNEMDSSGCTPLHQAVSDNNKTMVKMLLAAGADIHHKNNRGLTPLLRALQGRHIEILSMFLEASVSSHP